MAERTVREARAYCAAKYRAKGWKESGSANAIFTAPSGRNRIVIKKRTVRVEKRGSGGWFCTHSHDISVIDAARIFDGGEARPKKVRPAKPTASMESEVNRGLLAQAVGRMIFCPDCKTSLDVSSAVLITTDKGAGISCGKCFHARYSLAELRDLGFDVIAGEELGAA